MRKSDKILYSEWKRGFLQQLCHSMLPTFYTEPAPSSNLWSSRETQLEGLPAPGAGSSTPLPWVPTPHASCPSLWSSAPSSRQAPPPPSWGPGPHSQAVLRARKGEASTLGTLSSGGTAMLFRTHVPLTLRAETDQTSWQWRTSNLKILPRYSFLKTFSIKLTALLIRQP